MQTPQFDDDLRGPATVHDLMAAGTNAIPGSLANQVMHKDNADSVSLPMTMTQNFSVRNQQPPPTILKKQRVPTPDQLRKPSQVTEEDD